MYVGGWGSGKLGTLHGAPSNEWKPTAQVDFRGSPGRRGTTVVQNFLFILHPRVPACFLIKHGRNLPLSVMQVSIWPVTPLIFSFKIPAPRTNSSDKSRPQDTNLEKMLYSFIEMVDKFYYFDVFHSVLYNFRSFYSSERKHKMILVILVVVLSILSQFSNQRNKSYCRTDCTSFVSHNNNAVISMVWEDYDTSLVND